MLDTIQQIITLAVAFVSLIGAAVGVFTTIKTLISKRKGETKQSNFEFLKSVALSAMSKAEESGKSGKEKKEIVLDAIKAAAKEAGIEIEPFLDQLFAFIDNSIAFANTIK